MDNKLRQDLLHYMSIYPDYDVIPIVSGDVGDGECWAMAIINKVKLDEIAVSPYNDEHLLFRSDGAFGDFCDDYIYNDNLGREEIPDEEIEDAFDNLNWHKVILVYIEQW